MRWDYPQPRCENRVDQRVAILEVRHAVIVHVVDLTDIYTGKNRVLTSVLGHHPEVLLIIARVLADGDLGDHVDGAGFPGGQKRDLLRIEVEQIQFLPMSHPLG